MAPPDPRDAPPDAADQVVERRQSMVPMRSRQHRGAAALQNAECFLAFQVKMIEKELSPHHRQLLQIVTQKGDGSTLRGWRRCFDEEGKLDIVYRKFCKVVDTLGCEGDFVDLFAESDVGEDALTLSIQRFAPVQAAYLQTFRTWVVQKFDSPMKMFTAFSDGTGAITPQMFYDCCSQHHCPLLEVDLEDVFAFIDCDDDKELKPHEVVFLETDKEKRNEDIFIHKMQETNNRERFMAKIYTEQCKSKLHAKHRLANRPWNSCTFEALPTVFRQKVVELEKIKLRRSMRASIVFADHLVDTYGSKIKAWRRDLDPKGTFITSAAKVKQFCRRADLFLDAKDLLRSLDKNNLGFVSLEDVCVHAALALCSFHVWATGTFGTVGAIWDVLKEFPHDTICWKSSRAIPLKAFSVALSTLGWPGAKDPTSLSTVCKSLDVNACGHVIREDFEWLDGWKPSEWLKTEQDEVAWLALKAKLLHEYRHPLRAWRLALDTDGSNEVTWIEFKKACDKVGFDGNIGGAWRYLDSDLMGGISMQEYDPPSAALLLSFKTWSDDTFGSAQIAFQALDEDKNGSVSLAEFRKACRTQGWKGDSLLLFQCLKPQDENSKGLLCKDLMFLDSWNSPLRPEEIAEIAAATHAEVEARKPLGRVKMPKLKAASKFSTLRIPGMPRPESLMQSSTSTFGPASISSPASSPQLGLGGRQDAGLWGGSSTNSLPAMRGSSPGTKKKQAKVNVLRALRA